jgi:Carbohydrate binding module (family 35)
MDDDRERRLGLVPLVLVGVVVVALFVGAGTLLGGYLGRHAGASPRAARPPVTSAEPSSKAPTQAQPTEPPTDPPAAAAPVAYEAEDRTNTVSGGAFVATYPGASGGRIVKNLGTWGNPPGTGKLTFNQVQVPTAGRYTVTIFYVHVNGDATRTLVISVAGGQPVHVSVAGGAACCQQRAVTLTLHAGVNRISLTNPAGHAPAIDKITVAPR